MIFLGTVALLAMTVGLALVIARATLDLLFVFLGLTHPLLIRWHMVAFGAMLFWSWYLAPTLSTI